MQKPRRALASQLELARMLFSRTAGIDTLRARTLVFAPHPDDEVLGCGGTIARKVREGGVVQVVFMTDGSASHARLIDQKELVAIRRDEARKATAILGVPAERILFLDFPDHALETHHAAAVTRVRELLDSFLPEEIFVPHRGDRLADHVATFRIVRAALAAHPSSLRVMEYPVWLWNTWPWTAGRPGVGAPMAQRFLAGAVDVWRLTIGCRFTVDISGAIDKKRAALSAYRSQMQRRDGNPDWPVLGDVSDGDFLACFQSDHEPFRCTTHRV